MITAYKKVEYTVIDIDKITALEFLKTGKLYKKMKEWGYYFLDLGNKIIV